MVELGLGFDPPHGSLSVASRDVDFGAIISSQYFFQQHGTYEGILGMAYPPLAQPQNDPVTPLFDQVCVHGRAVVWQGVASVADT